MTPVYFDASAIVSLFVNDAHTDRAEAFLETAEPLPLVSDFAAAEFASALGLRVRMSRLTPVGARRALAKFDVWRDLTRRLETNTSDIALAETWLRRLDLGLRTPDALNLSLAKRAGAALLTFDLRMVDAAGRLDMELATA
jgi:predicted nucleic acid-binding protein